ncbi:hypothetical protein AMS68_002325 [Peltaster fructicola]|uniref:ferroxidase n=1 Tax=Peltaster fructicola TaxID=286661 RepID=A0A6H0XQ92_9PEZI|nr:hypothetical protein AMS68_002325 [Peltaster fructicola]
MSVIITADEAQAFSERLLVAVGVSREHAVIVAQCLVAADLRGVDTHGINRLPSYITRIRQGVLNARAQPTLTEITPVVAQIDAHNSFGFVAAHMGMTKAIDMARVFGIGMTSVKHSNHFGMSAWLVQQAVDAGMMSLVFTNSSPALPVWGGKSKLMGVSPIACGAPAGASPPFILDMAPSVAARGKIYKALRRGEQIPPGWALDAEGKETVDPAAALEGVMLPMGGPKGSALSIMMDVFSGVLSGSAFAGHVTNPYDPSRPADVGHFLVAIKPDLFMELEVFKERMDYLYQRVVQSEKADGIDRVYYPGEIEQLTEERGGKGDTFPTLRWRHHAINRRFPGLMPHSEDPEPPKNVDTAQPRTAAPVDDEEYHLHADEFINKVNERAEEIAEQRNDVEVDYSAGVLTITMPPNGTYVINKQPPNKQIWLSSPITGPKRYDWSISGESMDQKEGSGTGEWIYIRDGSSLSDLLRKELGIDATVGDLEKQLAQKSTDPVE